MFEAAINFIAVAHVNEKEVLVRCNQGLSRSPSIIMVYLAKAGMLTNKSFQDAREKFTKKFYKDYSPGLGISIFLEKNWKTLTD